MIDLTGIKVGLGLLAGLVIGWAVTDLVEGFALKTQRLSYEKQIANYVSVCENDKRITQEVSYDLQEKLVNLNDEFAAAQRLLGQRCVNIIAKPAAGNNGTKANPEFSKPNGGDTQVSADILLTFARDAEDVGRKYDSLQNYVSKTQVWFKDMKVKCDAHPV